MATKPKPVVPWFKIFCLYGSHRLMLFVSCLSALQLVCLVFYYLRNTHIQISS